MRVVVTGQVGLDKKPFLHRVAEILRAGGREIAVHNLGEMMSAEAPDVAPIPEPLPLVVDSVPPSLPLPLLPLPPVPELKVPEPPQALSDSMAAAVAASNVARTVKLAV